MTLSSYTGKGTGEVSLLRRMWNLFQEGDVLLADSLMCNWRNHYELSKRGVPVVTRLNKALRKADFRKGTRLGPDDHLVQWPKKHIREVGRRRPVGDAQVPNRSRGPLSSRAAGLSKPEDRCCHDAT